MNNNTFQKYFLAVVILAFLLISTPPKVLGQDANHQKIPAQKEGTADWEKWDYKLGEWTAKGNKKVIIAGIPMGAKRSEIMSLFNGKHIAPLQRTVPMDIFPRLIGEITYINKAYLFYTNDQLSKLTIIFRVPLEKNSTGEPLFDFYRELRIKLIQNYGQPTNSTAYVHPNFSYALVALETGNAFNLDYWENVDDMKIFLYLKGREGEIDFSLTYQYLPIFKEK